MKKLLITLLVIGLMTTVLFGCDPPASNNPINPTNNKAVNLSKIIDYGNGVFYFDYVGAEFGNALSTFIQEHPELEQISIAPNDTGVHGYTIGYFVTCRRK